jgi:hypothetical protein
MSQTKGLSRRLSPTLTTDSLDLDVRAVALITLDAFVVSLAVKPLQTDRIPAKWK